MSKSQLLLGQVFLCPRAFTDEMLTRTFDLAFVSGVLLRLRRLLAGWPVDLRGLPGLALTESGLFFSGCF